MSNPRHWCRPLQPSRAWMERYATACRNYVLEKLQERAPEIGYHIMSSNVFNYNLNQLDINNPQLRLEMREMDNAMAACIAIINNPAW